MKQIEISKYLKAITLGISILFLIFVVWFLPSVSRQLVEEIYGVKAVWFVCGVIWISAIPCFLCLFKFWGICVRIGKDASFCQKNARALKQMSHYLLMDCILYVLILLFVCIEKWYVPYGITLLFGIFLILIICITLSVLCASLSHLVYKASIMQEEQELTI